MTSPLQPLVGEWEVSVDLPGAEDARGHVVVEWLGELLVLRSTAPGSPVPDSLSVVVPGGEGTYVQHYFDARGVARLYRMTFDGRTWTLSRTEPDVSPLDFAQRYVGELSADGDIVQGAWEIAEDGEHWRRDFALVHRRIRR